ncbi:MAG TPA: GNAT family N-acetyltransferase [Polyangiaceae bacterium]|nr:GNAT family N-acetyltransferase [Polyangiaceae bacterium]
MSEIETRLTSDPADFEALAPSVAWAFGDETGGALDWLKNGEPGHVRVAWRKGKGRIEAGLLEVPMGQWFGGERLSLLGLAGVAIAPEARGQGVAFGLVQATLRAARERNVALSMLYPSTYRLYRKVGYELAGSWCRFTLQLRQLPRAARELAIDGLDGGAAEALYRRVACQCNGYLDRGPYVWGRVRATRGKPARGFGVSGPEGLLGYVYARPAELGKMPLELRLSDFVASTPGAFRALLSFLAEHSSTADRASWHGAPADARLLGLPERAFDATIEEYWMLRVVHVERALLGRGYPELDADIDLELEDDVLPENTRTYGLRVRAGKAELGTAASSRRARLGPRALAALYSGFVSPRELAWAGQLEADDRALATLAALFGGPAPGSPDFF